MADYGPKSHGSIFEERNKKRDNLPDYTGHFDITREFIEALKDAPRDEYGKVKIRVAGWNKRGPNRDYIGCEIQIAQPPREDRNSGNDRRDDKRDDRGSDRRDDRGGERRDDRGGYDQRDDRRDDRGRRRDDRRDEPEDDVPF